MCLFCKIIKKEIPAQIIYESDKTLIFKDISPQAKNHLLMIPKNHYQDYLAFSESEDFTGFFKELSLFVKNYKPFENGFRIVNNCGESAGQTVFHVHFHLIADKKLGSFGK